MAGRRSRAVALAVAAGFAALMAVPAAGAERLPVEGSLSSEGPTVLAGTHDLRAASPGILFLEGAASADGPADGPADGAADRFGLAAPGATAVLVNQPTLRVVTPAGPLAEEPLAQEVLSRRPSEALSFDGSGPALATAVRVLPTLADLDLGLAGARRIELQPASPLPPGDGAFGEADTLDGHATRPGTGAFVEPEGLGGLAWGEPFVAMASGGEARLADGTRWATGRWVNEARSAVDPVTGTGVVVYDNVVVLLVGRGGSLAWASSTGWGLLASTLQGPFSGDAAWTAVDADVRAGGEPLPSDPRIFQVKGDLLLSARFGQPSQWQISGEADFVGVDGRPSWAGPATGAAVAAGALALALGWLGRNGLLAVAARLAPRLRKAVPLSPARRLLLDAIHGQQPVGVDGLRAATGLTRTSLAYHLRVLLAYEVIQTRPGAGDRGAMYMLNSGSLAFKVFGEAPPLGEDAEPTTAAKALAVANGHPVRRAIYEAVRDHGPLDYARLSQLRVDQGLPALPQSSATHHLQLLVSAGVLAQERAGRARRYRVLLDDRDARVEQYRRFLGQERGLELVRRLADGPKALDDLVHGSRPDRRRLDRLVALGIVRSDPAGSRYHLAEFLAPWAHRL